MNLSRSMDRVLKVLVVISLMGILQLVQSCIFNWCQCKETIVEFHVNSITVNNIDGSGTYPVETDMDVMYASAVAFSIHLSDTTDHNCQYCSLVPTAGWGITPAFAWSCYCPIDYVITDAIQEFAIYSNLNLNPDYTAGSDVTHLFLANHTLSGEQRDLYQPIGTKLVELTSGNHLNPRYHFMVFLRTMVENDSAQFTLEFTMVSGRVLVAQTNLVSIIASN